MANVFDVAKYILHYCAENNVSDCSNKKLQKLLYYIQAWSLTFRDKEMFDDKIEAWLHGPVVSSIYHKYKRYGYEPISAAVPSRFGQFSDDDLSLMNEVLNGYAKYDAGYLEMRTHIEEPWVKARQSDSKVISNEHMKNYYKDVLSRAKK